ncbi:hypothetical protein NPIL_231251 [Nephila pilipes]|uniref:Uncharacterized protein n=1 Tax=Nephila pilipes TaxID=299642 RepID=A0A8X6NXP5_NEPPI|nr:hypothetical protein NPIL_231251 [Nephila pilipes]
MSGEAVVFDLAAMNHFFKHKGPEPVCRFTSVIDSSKETQHGEIQFLCTDDVYGTDIYWRIKNENSHIESQIWLTVKRKLELNPSTKILTEERKAHIVGNATRIDQKSYLIQFPLKPDKEIFRNSIESLR